MFFIGIFLQFIFVIQGSWQLRVACLSLELCNSSQTKAESSTFHIALFIFFASSQCKIWQFSLFWWVNKNFNSNLCFFLDVEVSVKGLCLFYFPQKKSWFWSSDCSYLLIVFFFKWRWYYLLSNSTSIKKINSCFQWKCVSLGVFSQSWPDVCFITLAFSEVSLEITKIAYRMIPSHFNISNFALIHKAFHMLQFICWHKSSAS